MRQKNPLTKKERREQDELVKKAFVGVVFLLLFVFSKSSILGYVLLILSVVFIAYFVKKQIIERRAVPRKTMEEIDQMNGYDFEDFLRRVFGKLGYKVEHTPLSGDQGADLILSKDGEKTAVQAKRYSYKITNKAVQEAVASKAYYNCIKAMVVTNNYYTDSAIKLANANRVELIDRQGLIRLIQNAQEVEA